MNSKNLDELKKAIRLLGKYYEDDKNIDPNKLLDLMDRTNDYLDNIIARNKIDKNDFNK